MWEDNRVEYNHLGGDGHVTTWGGETSVYLVCEVKYGTENTRLHTLIVTHHPGINHVMYVTFLVKAFSWDKMIWDFRG